MSSIVLPIHFGNSGGKHEINSESLLVFIESYKRIAESLNVSVEIKIGVPEEGGWKTTLIFMVGFIGASPITALITGKTLDEWAKIGHAEIIKFINKLITSKANNTNVNVPKECIAQKNKIYIQFQKDDCINSFHLDNIPLIPKNDFPLYIEDLPEDPAVYLGEANITVHSPDWKGKRAWRGQIVGMNEKESAFQFDKKLTGKFWTKVELDELSLHTTDVMRTQLIYRPNNKIKYNVIRVLSYNDGYVDSPLPAAEISRLSIIEAQKSSKRIPVQGILFDEKNRS